MNSVVTTLKVPQGLPRIARERGVWKDVLAYYQLKHLRADGRFSKRGFAVMVGSHLGISRRSAHRAVSRLLSLSYLVDSGDYYCMVSYDRLFQSLGYDLRRRNGNVGFKLNRVDQEEFIELKQAIEYNEIRDNLRKQQWAIRKRRGKQKAMPSIMGARYIDSTSLSCKRIASILGLSSQSSGFVIEQELVKSGYIEKKRAVDEMVGAYRGGSVPPGMVVRSGFVYRIKANIIVPYN